MSDNKKIPYSSTFGKCGNPDSVKEIVAEAEAHDNNVRFRMVIDERSSLKKAGEIFNAATPSQRRKMNLNEAFGKMGSDAAAKVDDEIRRVLEKNPALGALPSHQQHQGDVMAYPATQADGLAYPNADAVEGTEAHERVRRFFMMDPFPVDDDLISLAQPRKYKSGVQIQLLDGTLKKYGDAAVGAAAGAAEFNAQMMAYLMADVETTDHLHMLAEVQRKPVNKLPNVKLMALAIACVFPDSLKGF